MNRFRMCAAILGIASMASLNGATAHAQVQENRVRDAERTPATHIVVVDTPAVHPQVVRSYTNEPAEFTERDMSGPRLGFMVATSDGELSRNLSKNGMGRMVSLFGWHFEHRITPIGGGPQFLTEFVPLIGGVEYGKILPSMTLALGMRVPSGYEFGIGPSLAASGSGGGVSSGVVLSAGRSIDYGGVNLPINLAVSLNQKGTVMSLVAGYAVHRIPQ